MNYPFSKNPSRNLSRLVSLVLILVLLTSVFSGCSALDKKPAETTDDTSSNVPNIVDPPETSSVPEETETEPVTEAPKENIAIVKEQVSVRSSPSTGSRVVMQIDAGEEVEVHRIEPVGNVMWAFASSSTLGFNGWIVTSYLDMTNVQLAAGGTSTPANPENPSEGETTAPTTGNTTIPANATMGVVTVNDLNIRKEAKQASDRVGSYSYGDRIAVLEQSSGWGRTNKGWVSLSYVYLDGTTGKNTAKGVITATQLNVRSGPGTNYDIVGSVNQNAQVDILEQIKVGNTTWACLKNGWISMDYVSVNGSTGGTGNATTTTTEGNGVVTGNGLNIRSGAGTDYTIVGTLSKGDRVNITETVTVGTSKWGKISQGWICLDYVQMS